MKIPKDKLSPITPSIDKLPVKVIHDKDMNRGLGDVFHKFFQPITKIIPSLENCPSCEKRRNKLNAAFPFKKAD